MKVCSMWVGLEVSWVDSERFVHFHEGPRGICVGFSRHYRHLFHRFEAIFGPIWIIAGPFWDQHRVISVILDHFWVILGTFWGHFKIILTSFLGCFHIVLASFWGRFGDVFNPPFFLAFLACHRKAKNGSFWEVLGPQKCMQTVKPYFKEDTYSCRSMKKPDQTDTNSSRYGPLLVPKGPFYIADKNLFRSYLL